MMNRITLAVTGASGMPYMVVLLQQLLLANVEVNFVISQAGIITLHQELNIALAANPELMRQKLLTQLNLENSHLFKVYGNSDWYAPMASGSSVDDAMVICPCSMATLSKVANGVGDDLIVRSADVIIKERKTLLLVPRETPFSVIHLENMLKLARLGAAIVPPLPAFYTHPKTIADMLNFVVSRILDQLSIQNSLVKRW